jgi:muconolactone delta-isomerase
MIKLTPRYKQGNKSPDYDPDNPYNYTDSEGNKVVVSPKDFERYKDDPSFREIKAAIEENQLKYPGPEYEINPNFVRDLRSTYAGNMGYCYQNYRNFGDSLPEGYSFTPEGVIVGPDGTAYVQSGYKQTPRFTYSTDNPLQFTIHKGKPIERNLTFYPVNMDKRIKKPLPVNRVMDVGEEREKAVSNYLDNQGDLVRVPIVAGNYLGNNLRAYPNKEFAKEAIKRAFVINYTPVERLDVDFDRDGNPILIMPKKAFTRYRKEQLEYDKAFYKRQINDKNTTQYVRDFYTDNLNRAEEILDSYLKSYPIKPSRQEAEKKAVISIGPLEKVNTFATGGKLKLVPRY